MESYNLEVPATLGKLSLSSGPTVPRSSRTLPLTVTRLCHIYRTRAKASPPPLPMLRSEFTFSFSVGYISLNLDHNQEGPFITDKPGPRLGLNRLELRRQNGKSVGELLKENKESKIFLAVFQSSSQDDPKLL